MVNLYSGIACKYKKNERDVYNKLPQNCPCFSVKLKFSVQSDSILCKTNLACGHSVLIDGIYIAIQRQLPQKVMSFHGPWKGLLPSTRSSITAAFCDKFTKRLCF